MVLEQFTGLVRRCVEDYEMIQEGDMVAVGISGGKDSIALLGALNCMRRYYPKKFELCALTVDMGFEGMDFSPIQELCDSFGIKYHIKKTDIAQVVFAERQEKNPCSLCAKMRRGALTDAVNEIGATKLALGHHFDDAVETFMMCLVYEGRISCFDPVTYLDRSGVTQIRPMLYVGEGTAASIVKKYGWPVVKNSCPMDAVSKRQDVKELIKTLSATYPDLKSKIFGAIQRLPLNGWEVKEHTRRPLP